MSARRSVVCAVVIAGCVLGISPRPAAACVPTPWGGPCIGGAPTGSSGGGGSSSGAGGGGGGARAPSPPSGMLLSRDQRLERRGVDAANDCSDAIDRREPERAIDRCRAALDAYRQAFGTTSPRADEALRLLGFAQNALANQRLRSGRCAEAAALYREAVTADPGNAAYAHNLAGMQCRAQTSERVASDLRLAPPPPPLPPVAHRLAAATIGISTAREPPPPPVAAPDDPERWSELTPVIDLRRALAGARGSFRSEVPQAVDFLEDAAFGVAADQVGHGTPAILGVADRVAEARVTGGQYRQLVEQLVDEVAGAAHETVSVLGGGEGSAAHVLDAPDRMARMIDQFASERSAAAIWSEIKAWGTGRISRVVQSAGGK